MHWASLAIIMADASPTVTDVSVWSDVVCIFMVEIVLVPNSNSFGTLCFVFIPVFLTTVVHEVRFEGGSSFLLLTYSKSVAGLRTKLKVSVHCITIMPTINFSYPVDVINSLDIVTKGF